MNLHAHLPRISFVLVGALLLLAIPSAVACGGGGGSAPSDEYQYCHDYWIHVGDESTGFHTNEKTQFYLALLNWFYFEQDADYTDPLNSPLLSLWFYEEANGRAGMQRADEVCNNTPEGEDSDIIWC